VRSRRARLLAGAALAGLGILLALGLAEGALRLAGISYPAFETPDAARGVALRPGKAGWYRKEGEAFVRINSRGYRDREHAVAKAPNTLRIAVLGDSFVEARQVALEASFPVVLEQALADCPALRGRSVEVLNFGVGGYATTEALLTLRSDVLRFVPDVVLLAFYAGNDVGENSRQVVQGATPDWRLPKPIHVYAADGALVLERGRPVSLWRRALYMGVHHSRLLEVVNEVRRQHEVNTLRRAAGQAGDVGELGVSTDVYAAPTAPAWQDAWRVTEGLLDRLNRETQAGGARLVVTTVTMAEQVHPDPEVRANVQRRLGVPDLLYAERRIAAIGARHGFAVIGLAEPLRQLAESERIFLHGFRNTVPGYGHWNEAGHRAAAEMLARALCAGTLATVP